MRPSPAVRLLSTWIAALAVLLAALAPSVSRAIGGAAPPTSEICSADAGTGSGAPSGRGTAHPFEHCAFCSMHVPTGDLPPSQAGASLRGGLRHEAPDAVCAVPRAPQGWHAAQPRGPPADG